MQLNRNAPLALYYQLKQILENDIKELNLKEGDKLPSENTLMEKYNVSRTLIKQTFNLMINEGLVYRIQGKGTFVAKQVKRIKSTGNLGFILCNRSSEDHIYSNLLKYTDRAASKNKMQLIFRRIDNFFSNDQLPKMILDRTVDGVVVTGEVSQAFIKALKQSGIYFILLGTYFKNDPELTMVTPDDLSMSETALNYLREFGHNRIMLLRGPNYPCHIDAEKAFLELGGSLTDVVKCETIQISDAYELCCNVFNTDLKYTAIFASDTRLAIGALEAAKANKISVPDELSIISLGGCGLSNFTTPHISTVDPDFKSLCSQAVEILLSGFRNNKMEKGVFIIEDKKKIDGNSVK